MSQSRDGTGPAVRVPLEVFISSPGDVGDERRMAVRVLERLQGKYAAALDIHPIVWEWEPVRATATYQDQIPPTAESDIVICILWSRLGSALPAQYRRADGEGYPSGTAYEIETAATAFEASGRPDLLVYRKLAAPLVDVRDVAQVRECSEQWERLQQYLDAWFVDPVDGTFRAGLSTFERLDQFEELLERHLDALIVKHLTEADRERDLTTLGETTWTTGSPFRGLEPFEFEHATVFHGRTRAIAEAKDRLTHQAACGASFLLIYGMSGSGKSSLARAGLIPSITYPGVVEEVDLWRRCVTRPSAGSTPVRGLAEALVHDDALPELATGDFTPEELASLLERAPEDAAAPIRAALERAAQRLAAEMGLGPQRPLVSRLVLLIDQLEELFTDDRLDDAARAAFVHALGVLARSRLVWVIATMRSDLHHRCAEVPELVTLKDGLGSYELAPPRDVEIAQMIRNPARAAGLAFEEDAERGRLDDLLHEEARSDPASLPLLEFVLDALYEERTGNNLLTFSAYDALGDRAHGAAGGLEGAIARRADEVLSGLATPVRDALPELMTALVQVRAVEGTATSRSVPRTALVQTLAQQTLVDALLNARLLVADAGEVVRVAHEALLTRWPRARRIIADNREFLQARARIAADASLWQGERPGDLLLPAGKRLAEAAEVVARLRDDPAEATTVAYIEASLAADARRRRLRVSLVVGVIATLAVFLAGAVVQWQEAKTQANLALSRKLASDAQLAFASKRFDVALLLGAEGFRRARTKEAQRAFIELLEFQPFLRTILRGQTERLSALAFTPTDGLLLGGGFGGRIVLWDPEAGKQLDDFSAGRGLSAFAFDRDSKMIAVTGHSAGIDIFSGTIPRGEPTTLPPGCEVPWSVGAFVAGEALYLACRYRGIVRWDFAAGAWFEVTDPDDGPDTMGGAAFSSDRSVAAIHDLDGLSVWDLESGERRAWTFDRKLVDEVITSATPGIAFIPDAPLIVTASGEQLALWEVGESKPRTRLQVPYDFTAVAVGPDGRTIASGTEDGEILLWDVSLPRELGRPPGTETGRVRSLALGPDGRTLAVGGTQGLLMLWDVDKREPIGRALSGRPGRLRTIVDAYVGPYGRPVAVVNIGNTVALSDMLDGRPRGKLRNLSAQPQVDGVHARGMHARAIRTSIEILDFETQERFKIEELQTDASGRGPVPARHLVLSEDGRWLAAAYDRGAIVVVDLATARARGKQRGVGLGDVLGAPSVERSALVHHLWPNSRSVVMGNGTLFLSVDVNGSRVAISDGSKVVVWTREGSTWNSDSLSDGVMPPDDRTQPERDLVASLVLSPDGRVLAADTPAGMTVWALDNGRATYADVSIQRSVHEDPDEARFPSISFGPDNRTMAIRTEGGYLLWDAARGNSSELLEFPSTRLTRARFSADGKQLLAVSSAAMSLWDVESRRLIAADRRVHSGDVGHVAFDPTGTLLASVGAAGSVALWDLDHSDAPPSLFEYPQPVKAVMFAAKGRVLRVVDAGGTVHDREIATGLILDGSVRSVPSGATVLAADDEGNIRGWASKDALATRTGDVDRRYARAGGGRARGSPSIGALAVDAKGEVLVSDHAKDGLDIWQSGISRPIRHPLIGMRTVRGIRFSGEDRVIVLGEDTNGVALWEVRVARFLDRACRVVNRNLTQEEWDTYVGDLADYRETCPGR